MEKGTVYKIIYNDGLSAKGKTLIFERREGNLLFFYNRLRKLEEAINENKIIRIEKLRGYIND